MSTFDWIILQNADTEEEHHVRVVYTVASTAAEATPSRSAVKTRTPKKMNTPALPSGPSSARAAGTNDVADVNNAGDVDQQARTTPAHILDASEGDAVDKNPSKKYACMFWNVNGLDDDVIAKLEQVLAEYKVDMVFLAGINTDQETANRLLSSLEDFEIGDEPKFICFTTPNLNPEEIHEIHNLVLYRKEAIEPLRININEFAMNTDKHDRVLTLDTDDVRFIFLDRQASNATSTCGEFKKWFATTISKRRNVLFFGTFNLPANDWDRFQTYPGAPNPDEHQKMLAFLEKSGFTTEWVRESTAVQGQADVLFSRRRLVDCELSVQPTSKAFTQGFDCSAHKAIFFNVMANPWNIMTNRPRQIVLNPPFGKEQTYKLRIKNFGESLVRIKVESSSEHLEFVEELEALKTEGLGAGKIITLTIHAKPFKPSKSAIDWIILTNLDTKEQQHVKITYNTK